MFKQYQYLLFASASFLYACNGKVQEGSNQSSVKYPVTELQQRDTILSIPYVADLQAFKNVEIRSRMDGLLEKIYIREGQQVHKGQLLFKISDSDLRIELAKADATYKSAKADAEVARVEVERVKLLVENNVITPTELELAKAKYKALAAKADVALAEKESVEKRISYTSILAPFDGIVDRIPLKEGSLVSSASLLTTISDISTVYAYFNISENEYFYLVQNGNHVQNMEDIRLELPDGSAYSYLGKVAPAESEIDGNTGNIAFKAVFENPEKLLRHGASGKILITRSVPQAILAPQKAVFEIQDKNYVFLMGADSTVKMKSIAVNQRLADYYIVDNGLNSGDRIVVEGIQSLRDGQKIEPRKL